jgi:pimeloyl-ACP methyl ester carboxylesterase
VDFVLIHGAWHGGWCWRRVLPYLQGHRVFTPSLTGLGDRAHLAGPHVDLELHIQDVVQLLEMEDLSGVALVGHSYGGMVVTGAADRAPQRVRRLVYLDAFVPASGRCCLDYVVPERAAWMRKDGEASGFITPPPVSLWGLTKPEDVDWARSHEVKHPLATMTQPLRLTNEAALARIPKTYVYCSTPATGSFDQFAARLKSDPSWRFHELRTGHDAMILQPKAVSEIFLREE